MQSLTTSNLPIAYARERYAVEIGEWISKEILAPNNA